MHANSIPETVCHHFWPELMPLPKRVGSGYLDLKYELVMHVPRLPPPLFWTAWDKAYILMFLSYQNFPELKLALTPTNGSTSKGCLYWELVWCWEMVRWGLFLLPLWGFLCKEIAISKPRKTLLALPTKARILCLDSL